VELDKLWEIGVLDLVADEAKRQPLHVHPQTHEYVQLARGVRTPSSCRC